MKALIYKGPETLAIEERAIPDIKGNALIKVSFAGICGSDLSILAGKHPRAKAPLILGHEFTGVVEDIGDNLQGIKRGDRVLVCPTVSCGKCLACRTGHENVCSTLKFYGIDCDGGMAQYASVPPEKLLLIPEGMGDDLAVAAEPLACVIHAVRESNLKITDKALITGAGPMGMFTAIVLKKAGLSDIFITEIDPYRLSVAKELGIRIIDAARVDALEYVREKTNGEGADIVFEASGAQASASSMTELVRTRGQIVMLSIFKQPPTVDLRSVNFKEINMIGARAYTREEFELSLAYANNMKEALNKVITHRVPLETGTKAFDIVRDKTADSLKVLIKCN